MRTKGEGERGGRHGSAVTGMGIGTTAGTIAHRVGEHAGVRPLALARSARHTATRRHRDTALSVPLFDAYLRRIIPLFH